MTTYIYREDSGYDEKFEAETDEAAEEYARELLRTGEYGQEQADKTFTVRAQVARLAASEDGEEYETDSRTVTWTFEPAEPPCDPAGAEHDWFTHSESGHGGGVIIRGKCDICGCERVTDTWGQDPATGEVVETTAYTRADVTA